MRYSQVKEKNSFRLQKNLDLKASLPKNPTVLIFRIHDPKAGLRLSANNGRRLLLEDILLNEGTSSYSVPSFGSL